MDWSYVAGYFDGEGCVGFYATKHGGTTHGLTWHNNHRRSLEAMRDFMGAGYMHERKARALSRQPSYTLTVAKRSDLLRVLDLILPHLIIKRDAAQRLRKHVLENVHDAAPGRGKLAAVSTEQLTQWYHIEGKSYAQIAAIVGVGASNFPDLFRQRGIKPRALGAHLKGRRRSEEARKNMRDARARMWKDPAFRTAQIQNMVAGRRRYLEQRRLTIAASSFTKTL